MIEPHNCWPFPSTSYSTISAGCVTSPCWLITGVQGVVRLPLIENGNSPDLCVFPKLYRVMSFIDHYCHDSGGKSFVTRISMGKHMETMIVSLFWSLAFFSSRHQENDNAQSPALDVFWQISWRLLLKFCSVKFIVSIDTATTQKDAEKVLQDIMVPWCVHHHSRRPTVLFLLVVAVYIPSLVNSLAVDISNVYWHVHSGTRKYTIPRKCGCLSNFVGKMSRKSLLW